MPDTTALATIVSVAGLVLICAALYAVFALVKTLRQLQVAAEDVRSRLVPLLDKADVTVDALNAELLRLDGIVTQVEEVSGAVSAAGDFLRSPVGSIVEGATRVARVFRKR